MLFRLTVPTQHRLLGSTPSAAKPVRKRLFRVASPVARPARFSCSPPTPAMLVVHTVPALSDNYMYLVADQASRDCAAVDPVEPDKIVEHARRLGYNLTQVLTTHHHWDHAGGNARLAQTVPNLALLGGDSRIEALTRKVVDGDTFKVGAYEGRCICTPCHTSGHVCFYMEDGKEKYLFTGDTLFVGGCGRFFEGTADQMYDALIGKLGRLPDETKVFCGHDYAVPNLQYAVHAQPGNLDAKEKLDWAKQRAATKQFSVPSTIGDERTFNPFMRVNDATLKKRAGSDDPIRVMHFLREEKNAFRA